MSGKFSPPAGQAQLIIGQDTGSIDAYAESTHVIPGEVTNYTSVSKLEGIHQTADYGYQNKH